MLWWVLYEGIVDNNHKLLPVIVFFLIAKIFNYFFLFRPLFLSWHCFQCFHLGFFFKFLHLSQLSTWQQAWDGMRWVQLGGGSDGMLWNWKIGQSENLKSFDCCRPSNSHPAVQCTDWCPKFRQIHMKTFTGDKKTFKSILVTLHHICVF